MTAQEWVSSNFDIDYDILGEPAIDWGNGIYTPVAAFVSMFGIAIEAAIAANEDVRAAIRAVDNGRGFASLV